MEILGILLARYSSGGEAFVSGLMGGVIILVIIIIYNGIKKWINKNSK